jgi:hypothetical protein
VTSDEWSVVSDIGEDKSARVLCSLYVLRVFWGNLGHRVLGFWRGVFHIMGLGGRERVGLLARGMFVIEEGGGWTKVPRHLSTNVPRRLSTNGSCAV